MTVGREGGRCGYSHGPWAGQSARAHLRMLLTSDGMSARRLYHLSQQTIVTPVLKLTSPFHSLLCNKIFNIWFLNLYGTLMFRYYDVFALGYFLSIF